MNGQLHKKRGYCVHNGDNDQPVLAVVATSAKEAKKIAYNSGEIIYGDTGWIYIRVYWRRDARVDDLPIGIVHNERVALLHGIYAYLGEYPCDVCGCSDAPVHCNNGQVLCDMCDIDANV